MFPLGFRRACFNSAFDKRPLSQSLRLLERFRCHPYSTSSNSSHSKPNHRNPWIVYPTSLFLLAGAGTFAYYNSKSFRYTLLATVRCSRVAGACHSHLWQFLKNKVYSLNSVHSFLEAAILGCIDYKITFLKTYASQEEQLSAYSKCHTRSAKRLLQSLLANGGALINLHE